jgi:hypothetical protein
LTSHKINDERYARILLKAIAVCRNYKPKFGAGGEGQTLVQFQTLYGADPFYAWMGLDSPLMYSAHKAAGGMTSVYRQIGIGIQFVFTQILIDQFELTAEDAVWSYMVDKIGSTKQRKLSLDGRIPIASVKDAAKRKRVEDWMRAVAKKLGVDKKIVDALKGPVFEVRQGYKSMDSKRQNADIANAATAYMQGYLPVALLVSMQIDGALVTRYTLEKWALLRGMKKGDASESTFAFCKEVVGYDLAGFFERNSPAFKKEIEITLKSLLTPS